MLNHSAILCFISKGHAKTGNNEDGTQSQHVQAMRGRNGHAKGTNKKVQQAKFLSMNNINVYCSVIVTEMNVRERRS